MHHLSLLCAIIIGSTLCSASFVKRDPPPISNVAMQECTEANYGGTCVVDNNISDNTCHYRNRQGYGLTGSIQLGSSLICRIYQDGACESSRFVDNVLPSAAYLKDLSDPFWTTTAGFVPGGPGPESWRCRVYDGKSNSVLPTTPVATLGY